ncbi:MAG TPA: DUF1993 domain-containing protein [Polyangiaceae bacterium]|jgi:hypothetical protein
MSISIHDLATGTFVPKLRTLSALLEKAAEHASAKSIDLAAIVQGRLAPDMYTLRQQVQLACFQAEDAAARLAGQDGGTPEEIGDAFADLASRIETTLKLLEGMPASAFDGAEDRTIIIPVPGGEMVFEMTGYQFLRDWALPHFYFHLVTAYDILRNLGVEIGKRDYMRSVGGYLRRR